MKHLTKFIFGLALASTAAIVYAIFTGWHQSFAEFDKILALPLSSVPFGTFLITVYLGYVIFIIDDSEVQERASADDRHSCCCSCHDEETETT